MKSILHDGVELRHLRYFRAVAEAGSFSRAAALIGLRQPTLSQQIAQMERALGAKLFSRTRRVCRLSPAGETLMPYVQRVLGEVKDLRRSLEDLSGLRQGTLTVAVLPVLTYRVMPLALARFHREYPGIRVRLLEMSVDEMERALVLGTAEMGIGCIAPSEASLRAKTLFSEEFVAVVSNQGEWRERESVSVQELASRRLIVAPPGYGTRGLLMKAFAQVRRNPVWALETSSVDVALKTAADGSWVALWPESGLWGRDRSGAGWRSLRISRPQIRRQIGFLDVHGTQARPAAEAFMPFVRAAAKEVSAKSNPELSG